MIELDEVLLNPASVFDELGQHGSRPEVVELGRDWGEELVVEFSDGGTGVLVVAKLDIELVPLGQKCVNCVVGLHGKMIHGSQCSSVLVRGVEAVVKQEEG